MKRFYVILIVLLAGCSSWVSAQNDTLVGVLRNQKLKVIKRYPLTLGRENPVQVETDKLGVFTIPNANLNDTLFVVDKKTKAEVAVPVEGYPYITITLENNTFKAERGYEPGDALKEIRAREQNKKRVSNVMNREDIQLSGCTDITCLLRRMSGVTFVNGSVRIRSSASLSSPTDPLVVVDGIPSDVSILSTIAIKDISELSVLKDGSAYGVRGANGVIVIKTGK